MKLTKTNIFKIADIPHANSYRDLTSHTDKVNEVCDYIKDMRDSINTTKSNYEGLSEEIIEVISNIEDYKILKKNYDVTFYDAFIVTLLTSAYGSIFERILDESCILSDISLDKINPIFDEVEQKIKKLLPSTSTNQEIVEHRKKAEVFLLLLNPQNFYDFKNTFALGKVNDILKLLKKLDNLERLIILQTVSNSLVNILIRNTEKEKYTALKVKDIGLAELKNYTKNIKLIGQIPK